MKCTLCPCFGVAFGKRVYIIVPFDRLFEIIAIYGFADKPLVGETRIRYICICRFCNKCIQISYIYDYFIHLWLWAVCESQLHSSLIIIYCVTAPNAEWRKMWDLRGSVWRSACAWSRWNLCHRYNSTAILRGSDNNHQNPNHGQSPRLVWIQTVP